MVYSSHSGQWHSTQQHVVRYVITAYHTYIGNDSSILNYVLSCTRGQFSVIYAHISYQENIAYSYSPIWSKTLLHSNSWLVMTAIYMRAFTCKLLCRSRSQLQAPHILSVGAVATSFCSEWHHGDIEMEYLSGWRQQKVGCNYSHLLRW